MNSAPQVQTAELSDDALDAIAGGNSAAPGTEAAINVDVNIGADVLVQVGGAGNEVLGSVGVYAQAGLHVSL